jgi:hypothetical protein
MQLLIVRDDAEIGEQLMSMLKDYTAHQCDLVEGDAAAFRWAQEHARCGLLLAQLEGPAVDGLTLGGSLGEISLGILRSASTVMRWIARSLVRCFVNRPESFRGPSCPRAAERTIHQPS